VTRVWCEYAWLGGPSVSRGVTVEIDGGQIARVVTDTEPHQGAESRSGLTLPGLANVHSHAFQRVLRARTQRTTGSFWTWREAMYEAASELSPEQYLSLATTTFAEMALAGITLVGEFHYLHHQPGGTPYADPNEMGAALIAAADAVGVRLTLLDACYLHGGIGKPVEGTQQRFADADVDAWAGRVEQISPSDTVKIGAAAHSVRALSPEELAEVAAWSASRATPLHAHVSEQKIENEECVAAYGRTPVEILRDAGCLNEQFTAVHATHLTPDDVTSLGDTVVTCCLCPTTERDLADGVGRPAVLRAAGAALAFGSDSQAVIDPFEEARAAELDERLATHARVNTEPEVLLAAATESGYRALGWDGGRIEPGAPADLVNLSLDSVRLAGTAPDDLVAAAVYAAAAADVRDVMVDGRWIVRDGNHVSVAS
jgi:formiminoglutamate deiminase